MTRMTSRRHLLSYLAALVIFCIAPSFGQNSSSDDHLVDVFSQAQAAQQQGDYRTAAKCYEEIVKLRPDVAEAWANLGLMHQFLQEYSQADHAFQIALNRNPRLYVPNLFLGLNQLRAQQPTAALRYLKLAATLNSRDEQAAIGLAHAYQATHDNFAASKWFSRATQIAPNDPDAWYGLGVAYLSLQDAAVVQLAKTDPNQPYARALVADAFVVQGRTKDAIDIYNKLLASPVQPPCLLAGLGFAYLPQNPDLSRKSFQNQLQKDPACLTARIGLARLHAAANQFPEALQEAHAAWRGDPAFLRANVQLLWRGMDADQLTKASAWLHQSNQQDDLAQFLERSLETGESGVSQSSHPVKQTDATVRDTATPQSLWAAGHFRLCEDKLRREKSPPSLPRALLLAQCSFFSGDYLSALTAGEIALAIDSHSPASLYWKAKSSQQLAADALDRMSAAAPNSPKVHLLLAELHRAREEFAPAEAEYNQVLSSGSNDPAAHLGLAQVYYQNSQDDKAIQQLQFVLQADAASPQASLVMGEILVRQHQYKDAIPYLKTALNGSPLSLPQVHSLLARSLAAQGDYSGALAELKPALPSDPTGIFHYQLYQLYQKLGDEKSAAAALQESQRLRREESAAEEKQKAMEGAGSPH